MHLDPPADPIQKIAQQLDRRRGAAAAAWNLTDEVVLIGAGEPVSVPGRYDRTYPFRSHSEYFYLTDRERPGGVLAFDPKEGWVEFLAPVTREELLWQVPMIWRKAFPPEHARATTSPPGFKRGTGAPASGSEHRFPSWYPTRSSARSLATS